MALIYLMSVKLVNLDIIPKTLKNELGDLSKNMPKIWFSYIRMLLFQHLKKFTKIYFYFINNREHILARMKRFLLLSHDTMEIKKCDYTQICQMLSVLPVLQYISYQNPRSYHNGFAVWILNSRLRLNLTFFTIEFSMCTSKCHFGGGEHSYITLIDGCSFYCSNYAKKNYMSRFCGQYSTFSFYSKHNQLNLDVTSEYKVHAMSITIDRNEIVNEPVMRNELSIGSILQKVEKLELISKVKEKFELLRYFVKVKILNNILLKINDSKTLQFKIFDGPGLLANTINETKKYMLTSTFHCSILLLKSDNNTFHQGLLAFTSHKIPIQSQKAVYQSNKSMLYYPNEKCKEGSCISSFRVDKGHQVNITTISVKSTMFTHIFNCFVCRSLCE